jgi:hypothetical protein
MIEALIAKLIGSAAGFVGVAITIVIQVVLWFFGTFILGSIVWLIYTLTNRRRS